MPHKKIRIKKKEEKGKVKGQGQEIRATTTIPPTPFLHQNLKEGEGSNLLGQVATFKNLLPVKMIVRPNGKMKEAPCLKRKNGNENN
ncbi:hypothetical protein [Listeria monocytogenes]|uniref:hypothetical protein n=1 Tax=Listeria monocytogenes TaxID=1639 RepID=UPI0011EB26D2|nr:hypothetical protein [Listeria monocytogenes]TYV00756.1 hypothetical protein FZ054_15165 [Listeria monocytogenes]